MEQNTPLNTIFNNHKTDKGTLGHFYHTVYEKDLKKYRNRKHFNLLEVGILRGESISAWLEYFPKETHQINAIDTFERVKEADVPILKNNRVTYYKGSSMDKSIIDAENTLLFDVIIDDGLHTPRANAKTFENLIRFLKDDGIYYIEDVWPLDIMTKEEWEHRWLKSHPEWYKTKDFDYFLSVLDGYDVSRIDLRATSGKPDSYIFKVTKSPKAHV